MFNKRSDSKLGGAVRGAPAPGGRCTEVLGQFGLLIIVLMLSGLSITAFVVVFLARDRAHSQVDEAAPVLMNLVAGAVHDAHDNPPEHLRRLANGLTRLPYVQMCRIELDGRDGAEPQRFEACAPGEPTAERQFKTEIRDPDGRVLGRVEVGYGNPPNRALTGMFWSAAGLIAIVCLAAFWLVYRWMQRRFRPIAFVRANLMAYHTGAERSLELLTLQDAGSGEAEAWNALIGAIRDTQQELDAFRCRQVVVDSLQNLQSQSSQVILNALPIGVVRIDTDDRIAYANRSAKWLLQFNGQTEDKPLSEQVLRPDVAELMLGLRQRTGGSGVDCHLEHGGGRTVVRLTSIALGPESDDLVVTVQDTTQLKDAERSRDEFLAHITHELRTPLTNIRAYAETLNDDFFDDEQTRRECYNVIMTETQRLSKLIENVLSVSQIEAGAAQLTRVTLRVEESLRQAVQDVQATADAKSIELALRIPSKVPPVSGDRHRLQQVWTNLIGNAIKYTPQGGSVSITVEPGDSILRVCVADTGIGIAPEYRERVFEKFFRVQDTQVEAEEGTGLGLAITQEIVRLHGGSIWVESELGVGTTLVVELPVSRPGEGAEQAGVTDVANRDR